jgi:hypothetical protein
MPVRIEGLERGRPAETERSLHLNTGEQSERLSGVLAVGEWESQPRCKAGHDLRRGEGSAR